MDYWYQNLWLHCCNFPRDHVVRVRLSLGEFISQRPSGTSNLHSREVEGCPREGILTSDHTQRLEY